MERRDLRREAGALQSSLGEKGVLGRPLPGACLLKAPSLRPGEGGNTAQGRAHNLLLGREKGVALKGTTLGVLRHISKDFILQLVRGTIRDPAREQERYSVPEHRGGGAERIQSRRDHGA